MRASIKVTKLDPGKWPPGAKISEITVSGVTVAVYVPLFTQQITVVFNANQNEMYTATAHDIAKGIVLAGIKNINRR